VASRLLDKYTAGGAAGARHTLALEHYQAEHVEGQRAARRAQGAHILPFLITSLASR